MPCKRVHKQDWQTSHRFASPHIAPRKPLPAQPLHNDEPNSQTMLLPPAHVLGQRYTEPTELSSQEPQVPPAPFPGYCLSLQMPHFLHSLAVTLYHLGKLHQEG